MTFFHESTRKTRVIAACAASELNAASTSGKPVSIIVVSENKEEILKHIFAGLDSATIGKVGENKVTMNDGSTLLIYKSSETLPGGVSGDIAITDASDPSEKAEIASRLVDKKGSMVHVK